VRRHGAPGVFYSDLPGLLLRDGCAASCFVLGDFQLRICAVRRNGVERMKGLPRHPLWVERPILVALGIAAGRAFLRHRRNVRLGKTRADFFELGCVIRLDAEVIKASLVASRRDREINARVVDHPFGVVRLLDARLRPEKGGIEPDALLQIMYGDVNVKPLH